MTEVKASVQASSSAARVRAARARSAVFTLLQHNSIGDRSGEYGGRYSSVACAASIVCRIPATLWALRCKTLDELLKKGEEKLSR